jgi:hypothetical protein
MTRIGVARVMIVEMVADVAVPVHIVSVESTIKSFTFSCHGFPTYHACIRVLVADRRNTSRNVIQLYYHDMTGDVAEDD